VDEAKRLRSVARWGPTHELVTVTPSSGSGSFFFLFLFRAADLLFSLALAFAALPAQYYELAAVQHQDQEPLPTLPLSLSLFPLENGCVGGRRREEREGS
jgi:hypothetical protein